VAFRRFGRYSSIMTLTTNKINLEGEQYSMKDSILFWNEVALEANRVSHTNGKMEQAGPPLSARALGIVHLAMYDAYAAVNKAAGLSPYLPGLPPPPPGASAQAAVAGAAHKTLSNLYRAQRDFFDAKLEEFGGQSDPGFGFGETVARAILEDRDNDPGVGAEGYLPPMGRGGHRVDPDNPGQGFHGPFYGAGSKGFAITESVTSSRSLHSTILSTSRR
jgi:hypothetical protein